MATCPACGNGLIGPVNYCPECGTRLGAPSEEFKVVTAIFCDVVGSTALGRRLEPQRMQRVMDRYGEIVRRVLASRGGSVGKRRGDGFMAAFGIPELHEDDALRAVRAAGELRSALGELAGELRREWGTDLKVRLGVNTGNVLVREDSTAEDEITGDAVNFAKRLEEAAGPDEILIGEQTYQLVADAVRAEAAGSLAVDSLPEPQEVWRLLEVLPERPGRASRLVAPMVGRGPEQGLLLQVFNRVETERSCHLVAVLGSAGIGKSRLADEFAASLGERATVLRAHCLSYGDSATLWPMVEIVRQAAGISPSDPPTKALERLATVMGEEHYERARRLVQLVGLGRDDELSGDTARALQDFLEALAGHRPVVVFIDDIQWAEPTLLDLIEHIADSSLDAPLMLVCIARPDELFGRRPGWPGGKVNALTFLLSPLSEPESEQLVRHLLRGKVDSAAQAHITEWAQGVPLIVEELVANLLDEGKLRRSGDRWELRVEEHGQRRDRARAIGWGQSGEGDRSPVPTSIQALLLARLERLSPNGRELIQRAAVVGEQFYTGDLEALSPQSDVAAGLLELVRHDLIRRYRRPAAVPIPPGSGDGYRFRHKMIRSVAYERMPEQLRAVLHERLADWLEQTAGDQLGKFDELVGYHLYEAFHYSQKLEADEPVTRELARRAGGRYAVAGQRAAIRGDLPLASVWLDRAVRLLQADDPVRMDALLGLAETLQAEGKLDEAVSSYAEILQAATAIGDHRRALHAVLGRLHVSAFRNLEGFLQKGRAEVERSVRILEEHVDYLGLAKGWYLLAYADWVKGQSSKASAAAERARAFAKRARDERWEARIIHLHCLILYWGPTSVDEVIQLNQEALKLARRTGMRSVEAGALTLLARTAAMRGDFEEARRFNSEASAIAVDADELLTQAADSISGGLVELLAGDPATAEKILQRGYENLEQMGATSPRAAVAAMLARVLLKQGLIQEAEEMTHLCEQIAAAGDLEAQVRWRSLRAQVLLRKDETVAARKLAAEGVALAEGSENPSIQADAWMALAQILEHVSRSEAREAAERALRLYQQKGQTIEARQASALTADLEKVEAMPRALRHYHLREERRRAGRAIAVGSEGQLKSSDARQQAEAWLVGCTPPLIVGEEVIIAFAIRESVGAPSRSDENGDRELDLHIMLWADDATITPGSGHRIVLPRAGRTEPLEFRVRPEAEGALNLRFRIYLARESELLQELVAELPVAMAEKISD